MKRLLKYIRNIAFVNKSFRTLLKFSDKTVDSIIKRWPVSGFLDIQFNNLKIKMYSKGDDPVANALYYNRYHESKDLKLFLAFAKKAKVIFDIGANTGIYSCLSSLENSKTKVFAFEPYPINIRRLEQNIKLNELTNIVVTDKALGNVSKKIQFAVPIEDKIADTSSADIEFSKNTYDGEISWKIIEVDQIPLDLFVYENKLQPDVVKIDVEGYEMAVFDGAKNTLTSQGPLIQCEILLDEERKNYFDNFLKETGYYAYLILNDGILRIGQSLQINPSSLNYIFSKRMSTELFMSYSDLDLIAAQLI